MFKYTEVQSKFIGPAGKVSLDYVSAEALNELTTLEQKSLIFDTSNLIIKYYVFSGILYDNETLALEKLVVQASDSAVLSTRFGCNIGSSYFNNLLFNQYYSFVRTKYYLGGGGMQNGIVYSFPKKTKRKIWKRKEQELRVLWQKYLDKPFIKFNKYEN